MTMDPFIALESIHLDEQLIESLLAFVVPSPGGLHRGDVRLRRFHR